MDIFEKVEKLVEKAGVSYEDAKAMIDAGASRLGASAGKQIIEGAKAACTK